MPPLNDTGYVWYAKGLVTHIHSIALKYVGKKRCDASLYITRARSHVVRGIRTLVAEPGNQMHTNNRKLDMPYTCAMAKYFEVLVWFFFFVALTLLSLELYYNYTPASHHSLVPLCISVALTIVVGIFTGMAFYEVFRHRNDKEPW
jgi:hypothetical protein